MMTRKELFMDSLGYIFKVFCKNFYKLSLEEKAILLDTLGLFVVGQLIDELSDDFVCVFLLLHGCFTQCQGHLKIIVYFEKKNRIEETYLINISLGLALAHIGLNSLVESGRVFLQLFVAFWS